MTLETEKKKKKDMLITIIRHGGSAIRFKSQPHVWTAHSLPSLKVKKTFGACKTRNNEIAPNIPCIRPENYGSAPRFMHPFQENSHH